MDNAEVIKNIATVLRLQVAPDLLLSLVKMVEYGCDPIAAIQVIRFADQVANRRTTGCLE